MYRNNKQKNFFIYDYETFGKNPHTDKAVQFSGIRTDNNFIPIEKPKIFYCSPPEDYLPEPEAIFIHGITPQQALKKGIIEAKFAQLINTILIQPNTCIIGYNNIAFDDEINRNIFYRNFCDPYSWSWKNNNSRWDILNVAKACYIFRPEGIEWPTNQNGIPNFKLNNLAHSNNIKHIRAHNAIDDVYATLELAKLIKKKQPKLFNYLYQLHTKQKIKQLINISQKTLLLHISNKLNQKQTYINYIIPITWHPNNPNILIAYNAEEKIEKLLDYNLNLSKPSIYLYNEFKNTKNTLKLIHINKCPVLTPINTIRQQDITRLKINPNDYLNKLKLVKKNYNYIFQKIKSLYSKTALYKIHLILQHTDTKLYNNFFHSSDICKINIIRNTSQKMLSQLKIHFIDDRLNSLFFYYKARNFSHSLSTNEIKSWKKYKYKMFSQEKILNYKNQLTTLKNKYKIDEEKIYLLNELSKYLKTIINT